MGAGEDRGNLEEMRAALDLEERDGVSQVEREWKRKELHVQRPRGEREKACVIEAEAWRGGEAGGKAGGAMGIWLPGGRMLKGSGGPLRTLSRSLRGSGQHLRKAVWGPVEKGWR